MQLSWGCEISKISDVGPGGGFRGSHPEIIGQVDCVVFRVWSKIEL
jgi:hypothetical protein